MEKSVESKQEQCKLASILTRKYSITPEDLVGLMTKPAGRGSSARATGATRRVFAPVRDVVVLDLRSFERFQEQHLRGSIHLQSQEYHYGKSSSSSNDSSNSSLSSASNALKILCEQLYGYRGGSSSSSSSTVAATSGGGLEDVEIDREQRMRRNPFYWLPLFCNTSKFCHLILLDETGDVNLVPHAPSKNLEPPVPFDELKERVKTLQQDLGAGGAGDDNSMLMEMDADVDQEDEEAVTTTTTAATTHSNGISSGAYFERHYPLLYSSSSSPDTTTTNSRSSSTTRSDFQSVFEWFCSECESARKAKLLEQQQQPPSLAFRSVRYVLGGYRALMAMGERVPWERDYYYCMDDHDDDHTVITTTKASSCSQRIRVRFLVGEGLFAEKRGDTEYVLSHPGFSSTPSIRTEQRELQEFIQYLHSVVEQVSRGRTTTTTLPLPVLVECHDLGGGKHISCGCVPQGACLAFRIAHLMRTETCSLKRAYYYCIQRKQKHQQHMLIDPFLFEFLGFFEALVHGHNHKRFWKLGVFPLSSLAPCAWYTLGVSETTTSLQVSYRLPDYLEKHHKCLATNKVKTAIAKDPIVKREYHCARMYLYPDYQEFGAVKNKKTTTQGLLYDDEEDDDDDDGDVTEKRKDVGGGAAAGRGSSLIETTTTTSPLPELKSKKSCTIF
mgnify:CR=1 FL=1